MNSARRRGTRRRTRSRRRSSSRRRNGSCVPRRRRSARQTAAPASASTSAPPIASAEPFGIPSDPGDPHQPRQQQQPQRLARTPARPRAGGRARARPAAARPARGPPAGPATRRVSVTRENVAGRQAGYCATHAHLRPHRRPDRSRSRATSWSRCRGAGEQWTRHTTVFHLHGGGTEGIGEDVVWDPDDQQRQQRGRAGARHRRDCGRSTTSREHLAELDLFHGRDAGVSRPYATYRRWALESAALDLALRQAGEPLHEVLGREPQPLTLRRLPAPRRPAQRRRRRRPPRRLRGRPLQARRRADLERGADRRAGRHRLGRRHRLQGRLQGHDRRRRHRSRALPALRRGVPGRLAGGPRPDRARGRRRARAPPRPHHLGRARSTRSTTFASSPSRPKTLNCKPSRFGPLSALFDFYDFCERRGHRASTAAASPSSARAAARCSCSRRCSIPTRPNDVAPAGWDQAELPRHGAPDEPAGPLPRCRRAFTAARRLGARCRPSSARSEWRASRRWRPCSSSRRSPTRSCTRRRASAPPRRRSSAPAPPSATTP